MWLHDRTRAVGLSVAHAVWDVHWGACPWSLYLSLLIPTWASFFLEEFGCDLDSLFWKFRLRSSCPMMEVCAIRGHVTISVCLYLVLLLRLYCMLTLLLFPAIMCRQSTTLWWICRFHHWLLIICIAWRPPLFTHMTKCSSFSFCLQIIATIHCILLLSNIQWEV